VFKLQINHRASVTPRVTFLVVIQLLVSRNERHSRRLDCFFGFVSAAIQSLAYFLFPHFPVPRFLVPRFQRHLITQHCIYMSLRKLGDAQLTHYDCEIVAKHAYYSQLFGASGPAEIRGEVADPCKTRKKTPVQRVRCFTALSSGLTPPTPPPPQIRPPNAAADYQFVGAQLFLAMPMSVTMTSKMWN